MRVTEELRAAIAGAYSVEVTFRHSGQRKKVYPVGIIGDEETAFLRYASVRNRDGSFDRSSIKAYIFANLEDIRVDEMKAQVLR